MQTSWISRWFGCRTVAENSARPAYLRDAQLLILDKPTASLDAAGEADVFDNFADLNAGPLGDILFPQRFSTVIL
jgi:alpha-D-ribose 1-methylphosphonate 5-triphosphate synthase subunit PhnL